MDFHQCIVIPMHTARSYLFLYFGVLTFTGETSSPNGLVRVSKSRTGDPDTVFNSSDKACRIDTEYTHVEAQI